MMRVTDKFRITVEIWLFKIIQNDAAYPFQLAKLPSVIGLIPMEVMELHRLVLLGTAGK
jgi:hypothetical protein